VIRFADGKFPTPSGRVEIASASAEADGHPRVPQPDADARPADGQLRLLSPASEWLMNDSYGNDVNVLSKLGPACIYLNSEDAKALALEEGEMAVVSSQTGEIELSVRCSDIVARGVALAHKGRWPKGESGASNVNVLNSGERTDMGESSSVHGTLVRAPSCESPPPDSLAASVDQTGFTRLSPVQCIKRSSSRTRFQSKAASNSPGCVGAAVSTRPATAANRPQSASGA